MIRAVLWDFGGVITTSPFEAFNRYEREQGLPHDFIRTLNATNHHDNAWAKLERGEVGLDEFFRLYEAEAEAAGHRVDARDVLACLSGDVRPEMVTALRAIKRNGLKQGCLTNNFVSTGWSGATPSDERVAENPRSAILDLFDAVIESSRVGVRKPEPAFYRMACHALAIEPSEAVMLDDTGVNLKPAREAPAPRPARGPSRSDPNVSCNPCGRADRSGHRRSAGRGSSRLPSRRAAHRGPRPHLLR